jgi:hypothetical protein
LEKAVNSRTSHLCCKQQIGTLVDLFVRHFALIMVLVIRLSQR